MDLLFLGLPLDTSMPLVTTMAALTTSVLAKATHMPNFSLIRSVKMVTLGLVNLNFPPLVPSVG